MILDMGLYDLGKRAPEDARMESREQLLARLAYIGVYPRSEQVDTAAAEYGLRRRTGIEMDFAAGKL